MYNIQGRDLSLLNRIVFKCPIVRSTFFSLIPYTLNLTPYTFYRIPYTLYLTPYTFYRIPYTLYLIPFTLYLSPSLYAHQ